jgi:formate hydrogenlyase subunit 4
MIALVLLLITSFFFTGIIIKIKNFNSGKKGPGIFQPVKNVWVLLRKGAVYSETTSLIIRIAPVVIISAMLIATLMIPVAGFKPLISFNGDFILFAYLLALGRFMIIIAAFDTGSSFEGMGASREALYGMLIEPAFFIVMGSLCIFTGHTSLNDIFNLFKGGSFDLVFGLATVYILGNIALVENSRVPVDDPKTHLELTMIHEVMVLDTSGFDLALIQITSFLRFAIFGSLIASALIPLNLTVSLRVILFFAVQVLFSVSIGLIESFRARFKMNRNQQYILTISLIAFILFIVVILTKNIH